jgi:acyl-CoA thioester hydrolase
MPNPSHTRRIQKAAFPVEPGAPAPLVATAARRVRFEEVDPLGIVWHGRYPSYLEDGRAALGERYGLAYMDMVREGFTAPIVQMHLEYHAPLRFPEDFTIEASLHWTEAVRLNFSYKLVNAAGAITATGYTVQLILDAAGQVALFRPEYLDVFWRRWKSGGMP